MEFKTKTVTQLIEENLIGKLIEFYEHDRSTNLKVDDKIDYDNEEPYLEESDKENFINGEQIIYSYENNDRGQDFKAIDKYRRLVDKIIDVKNYRTRWIAITSKGYTIEFTKDDSFKFHIQM